jgi:hypothetical protein
MTIPTTASPALRRPRPPAGRAATLPSIGLLLGAVACAPATDKGRRQGPDSGSPADAADSGDATPLSPGGTIQHLRPEDCLTAGDEDGDGAADCADETCWGPACPEDCAGSGDEDADTTINCADSDCWGPSCVEDCTRGGDEDADGLSNCEDADCTEACVEDCVDLRDNDLDGQLDCLDVDCALSPHCWDSLVISDVGGAQFMVRSVHRTDWSLRSEHLIQTVSALIDHLELTPPTGPSSDDGAPCGLRFEGLALFRRYTYHQRPHSSWGDLDASSHAMIIEATGAGCPAPSRLDLEERRIVFLPRDGPMAYFAVSDLPALRISLYPLILTPTGMSLGPLRSERSAYRGDSRAHFELQRTWSATASGFTIEHD